MDINNAVKYTEKFSKDFQSKLFASNLFFMNTTKGEISKNISVNIPQFSTEITEAANPSSNDQLSVTEYTETNKLVTQERFSTSAFVIPDIEEFFTAQDLKRDCQDQMLKFIETAVGNFAAYKLAEATSGNTILTTGSSTRSTGVVGSSATVKVVSKADMLAVRKLMAKSNMTGKWYCLASPEQISDLLNIAEFTEYDKVGIQSKLINGEFANILGINFFERAPHLGENVGFSGSSASTTTVVRQDIYGRVGTADAVTDSTVGGLIFWNENAAYTNKGFSKFWVVTSATRQGDVMSMKYSYGIDPIRKDLNGLIVLAEQKVD